MRRLLLISLLLCSIAYADSVTVETPTLLSTSMNAVNMVGIPRHNVAVDYSDSLQQWILGGYKTFFHTNDAWATKDSTRNNGWVGDIHNNITIIPGDPDSIGMVSESEFAVMNQNTIRTLQSPPTNYSRGMVIGDSVNDRYWVIYRQGSPYDSSVSYAYTTNGGSSWTGDTLRLEQHANLRVGAFKYHNGLPGAIIIDWNENEITYYYWNGSGFVCNNDSMISTATITNQNRAFMFDMLNTSDGDTMMFFVYGDGNYIKWIWKSFNGGAGGWTRDSVNNANTSGVDWNPTMGLVNQTPVFAWVQTDATPDSAVYFSYWDVDGDTISTPEQISSGGHTGAASPNIIQYSPFNTSTLVYMDLTSPTAGDMYYATLTNYVTAADGADAYGGQVIMIRGD